MDDRRTDRKGSVRFRWLRTIIAIACAVACSALIILWWRSYYVHDNFLYALEESGLTAASYHGALYLGAVPYWRSYPFEADDGRLRIRHWRFTKPPFIESMRVRHTIALGFGVIDDKNEYTVFIPYWFLVTTIGLCAAISWPIKSQQYRLQTLLVAMTLVAIVLGLAAYFAKM